MWDERQMLIYEFDQERLIKECQWSCRVGPNSLAVVPNYDNKAENGTITPKTGEIIQLSY